MRRLDNENGEYLRTEGGKCDVDERNADELYDVGVIAKRVMRHDLHFEEDIVHHFLVFVRDKIFVIKGERNLNSNGMFFPLVSNDLHRGAGAEGPTSA